MLQFPRNGNNDQNWGQLYRFIKIDLIQQFMSAFPSAFPQLNFLFGSQSRGLQMLLGSLTVLWFIDKWIKFEAKCPGYTRWLPGHWRSALTQGLWSWFTLTSRQTSPPQSQRCRKSFSDNISSPPIFMFIKCTLGPDNRWSWLWIHSVLENSSIETNISVLRNTIKIDDKGGYGDNKRGSEAKKD